MMASQHNSSRRTTLFRCSDPQQQHGASVKLTGFWNARKPKHVGAVNDEKKRTQLLSAEMRIQIAQLVLGYT